MTPRKHLEGDALLPFVSFQTARSSGSGGQHVNKVETKVTLLFDLEAVAFLSAAEKDRIRRKLAGRLQADGYVQVVCQETRSQLQNKALAVQKLVELLTGALKTEKTRKATKPSKAAVQKRIDAKRRQALRKINRKKDWL